MTRMALFGGTFDPIHYGHLLLANDLLEILHLDRVLFVPAGNPPHKKSRRLAPAKDRYAMVERAITGHPAFAVSDIEVRRTGLSYTVDTLEALAAPDQELFLPIGSETFLDLLSWREPQRIARLARLVVVPRLGSVFDPESAAAQKVLRGIGGETLVHVDGTSIPERGVMIAHATSLPISGSELRRRVREGRSLAYRVPPAVIDYIRSNGLYRDEAMV